MPGDRVDTPKNKIWELSFGKDYSVEDTCSMTFVCWAYQAELQNIIEEVAFHCILKARKNLHMWVNPGKKVSAGSVSCSPMESCHFKVTFDHL